MFTTDCRLIHIAHDDAAVLIMIHDCCCARWCCGLRTASWARSPSYYYELPSIILHNCHGSLSASAVGQWKTSLLIYFLLNEVRYPGYLWNVFLLVSKLFHLATTEEKLWWWWCWQLFQQQWWCCFCCYYFGWKEGIVFFFFWFSCCWWWSWREGHGVAIIVIILVLPS